MKCPQCGENFTPLSVNQKYCSAQCGNKYRRRNPDEQRYPVLHFRCSKCGRMVVTDGKRDHRTRFCSAECEKKYWRHPPQEHSALNNYHAGYLEWYEKQEV